MLIPSDAENDERGACRMIYAHLEVSAQPGATSDKLQQISEDKPLANGAAKTSESKVSDFGHVLKCLEFV